MDKDYFQEELCRLTALYAKTKGYIIRAEEMDPTLRSNIAAFKEQRDGLDHIMRAFNEYLKGDSADQAYIRQQFGDAEGHLYRAAYDALDGMGISYKMRVNQVMDKFSLKAICAVYPKYFEALDDIDVVQTRIIEHRKNKDQRRTTLAELDDYLESVQTMDGHYKTLFRKIPFIQKWDSAEKRRTILLIVLIPLGIALLVVGLEFGKDWYWRQRDAKMQQLPPALSSPSPASASPSTSP